MKQSHLFTKTRREAPKGEQAKNAELLIRAGFVHKEMAGVYAYLPLGLRVVEKIKAIIRDEMNSIGGQEIVMTALQRKELWEVTDRWDDKNVDVWFKSELHAGGEVGFGWSHEEPITDMMRSHIASFRDLPVYVYQFQTKLRNELRAKSGIMRGREFVMKDLYSYDIDEQSHSAFYKSVMDAYMRVFKRVGVGEDTYVTFASGGAFTQFSHEFQTIVETGEDVIYVNREKHIAINKEVLSDKTLADVGVTRDELEEVKTAEVGNIFNFGTKKCEQLDLYFLNAEGQKIPVWLGSYGIGVTRLMGVLVDKFADEKGIVWPASVAPFAVHLIAVGKDETINALALAYYEELCAQGIEVLFDDRTEVSTGQKFADADLIGIPHRLVISPKTGDQIEYKARTEDAARLLSREEVKGVIQK